MAFLPVSKQEMLNRGYTQPDFVYVSGDAYVDHPSFGPAIICKTLEAFGYTVCMIAQPDWNDLEAFKVFGEPRLGFLVSSGNIDSMVNHYSVNKRRRDKDSYSDNGEMGKRPDRATIVYSQKIRECYKDSAIIIGGIEASLRRFSHYDYWDDKVRQSIIMDSNADIVLYGMGENTVVEVADALNSGLSIGDITYIRGSSYKTKSIEHIYEYEMLPSYEEVKTDKVKYCESFTTQYENTDAITANVLIEPYKGWYVVVNPPALPLTREQMDFTYSLDFERKFHPMYTYIPAIEEVQFSIISNRGCFGACSFCALTFHQGRTISSRSKESIVEEAKKIVQYDNFKGYIHDVGGPTANFYHPSCDKQLKHGVCKKQQCLDPKPCRSLKVDHTDYLNILRELRAIPKVKKVFVRSGVRYDYLLHDKDETFFEELVQHHISGQLKVAPEHVSNKVLGYMGKCNHELYEKFRTKYEKLNEKYDKKQFLVPYLMSSHPGSEIEDAIELAEYLKMIGHVPQQVQDFYPTPATLSTCMYYTGLHPITMESVYVAKSFEEKLKQRVLMQYNYPKNYEIVYKTLMEANRSDLIGFGKNCLIRPKQSVNRYQNQQSKLYTEDKNEEGIRPSIAPPKGDRQYSTKNIQTARYQKDSKSYNGRNNNSDDRYKKNDRTSSSNDTRSSNDRNQNGNYSKTARADNRNDARNQNDNNSNSSRFSNDRNQNVNYSKTARADNRNDARNQKDNTTNSSRPSNNLFDRNQKDNTSNSSRPSNTRFDRNQNDNYSKGPRTDNRTDSRNQKDNTSNSSRPSNNRFDRNQNDSYSKAPRTDSRNQKDNTSNSSRPSNNRDDRYQKDSRSNSGRSNGNDFNNVSHNRNKGGRNR